MNGFSCVCTTGWDGDRCQSERDECTLQLCLNGATCTVRQQVLRKYCKSEILRTGACFQISRRMGTYNCGVLIFMGC